MTLLVSAFKVSVVVRQFREYLLPCFVANIVFGYECFWHMTLTQPRGLFN